MRITSICGSQTSPVILCMQNSVPSIRITSLYGSQPSSAVFASKTATIGAELQVSMGPRPHLSFCACKPALLASELLVSMGPSAHLWFLHAKQRLFDYKFGVVQLFRTCSNYSTTHGSRPAVKAYMSSGWFNPTKCPREPLSSIGNKDRRLISHEFGLG